VNPSPLLPPHNLEAEMGALGSMLLDAECIPDVLAIVRPEDFYRETLGTIFRVVRDMNGAGKPIDALMLIEELKRRDLFAAVGGDDAIMGVMESPPHAANATYYAQIVRQKAVVRDLIAMGNQVVRNGYSNLYSSDELVARCEDDLNAIVSRGYSRDPATIADAAGTRSGGSTSGSTARSPASRPGSRISTTSRAASTLPN
jgi:replicative DNA helicase